MDAVSFVPATTAMICSYRAFARSDIHGAMVFCFLEEEVLLLAQMDGLFFGSGVPGDDNPDVYRDAQLGILLENRIDNSYGVRLRVFTAKHAQDEGQWGSKETLRLGFCSRRDSFDSLQLLLGSLDSPVPAGSSSRIHRAALILAARVDACSGRRDHPLAGISPCGGPFVPW